MAGKGTKKMKKWTLPIFVVFFFLFASAAAAEKYFVNIRLLRGTGAEEANVLKSEVLMTTASTPSLIPLRDPLNIPTESFLPILHGILIEEMNLASIDELFTLARIVGDDEYGMTETISDLSHYRKFKIHISIKSNSSGTLRTHLRIFKTHDLQPGGDKPSRIQLMEVIKEAEDESRMEKVLDREVLLTTDEPAIMGVPAGKDAYYVYLYPTRKIPPDREEKIRKPEALKSAMKPISQRLPAYPAALRRAGHGGDVILEVFVDEDGHVQEAKVIKRLHPYLDNAAVQAIRQWTYEPALQDGKPVAVSFQVSVNFDPAAGDLIEAEAKASQGETSYPEPLRTVLAEGAEYCRKMTNAILDFYCEETIKETHNSVGYNKWGVISAKDSSGVVSYQSGFLDYDLSKTIRKTYVCDYMMTRKGGNLEERRMILKENGRPLPSPGEMLRENRYKILAPLFASLRILGAERQWQYSYRIIDEERVKGKIAYVLEALPISGNADGIEYGKIWLDKTDYHILKCEIQGVPLEGYEDVLTETSEFNVKPVFTAKHEYFVENKGIHFPSRSEILANYSFLFNGRASKIPKMNMTFLYDRYKFFSVETQEEIKK